MTQFLSSEDQETRVQNDQQEQGYNLRAPQGNLRNEDFFDHMSHVFLDFSYVFEGVGTHL